MKKKSILLLFSVFVFCLPEGMAQIRKANRLFEFYDYSKAIPLYLKYLEKGGGEASTLATSRLADCYRLTNMPGEAAKWYSKATQLRDADPQVFFYYGQVLRNLEQYDQAEKMFTKYAGLAPEDGRGALYAGYCREIISRGAPQVNIEIKNAAVLNTVSRDFGAVFFKNGIVLVSDRGTRGERDYPGGSVDNGFFDLYYSQFLRKDGSGWQLSDPLKMTGEFNQEYHDGPVTFSGDFRSVFITRTGISKETRKEAYTTYRLKLYTATLQEGVKAEFHPFEYNSGEYSVGHAALPGNGKWLVFSSDMPGGQGGTDLYISAFRQGKWSVPMNMGNEINSSGNEVFPTWRNDSTLFFSSDGLPGYGGLDIYLSELKDGKWSAPVNLPAPVNSSRDDFGLSLESGTGNGFLSSNRPGGKGNDDIYFIQNFTLPPVRKNLEFSIKTETKPEPAAPAPVETAPVVQVLPEPKPETEPVIQEAAVTPAEPESYFTVQVRATYVPLDLTKNPRFEGEKPFFRQIGSFYKYFIGKFETFDEARGEYLRLRKKFADCFIVAFMDEEPIPVDVLRKIQEQEK